jgi:hypothetical protein
VSFGLVMRGIVPFMLLGLGMVALLSGYYRFGSEPEDLEEFGGEE